MSDILSNACGMARIAHYIVVRFVPRVLGTASYTRPLVVMVLQWEPLAECGGSAALR